MAKVRKNYTAVNGITSLLEAINKVAQAELGEVNPEQKSEANKAGLEAVQQATAIIGDSNMVTAMENLDEAIELQHQEEEAAEEAAMAAENENQ